MGGEQGFQTEGLERFAKKTSFGKKNGKKKNTGALGILQGNGEQWKMCPMVKSPNYKRAVYPWGGEVGNLRLHRNVIRGKRENANNGAMS